MPIEQRQPVDPTAVPLRDVQVGIDKPGQDPASRPADRIARRRLSWSEGGNPAVIANSDLGILSYADFVGCDRLKNGAQNRLHLRLLG